MFDPRTATAALAALGLALGAAAVPPVAHAEAEGYRLAQASTFNDEKIQAFVTAQTQVEEIRADYIEQMEGAGTEQQRMELSRQANEEMATAVQEVPGISIEEYNAIVDAAYSDPAFAERLNQELMQAEQ